MNEGTIISIVFIFYEERREGILEIVESAVWLNCVTGLLIQDPGNV